MRNVFSAHDLRRLAVEAEVDPRTATRWLAGLSVAAMCKTRLERAALKLGMVPA
jgi:hypothetical protein